MEKKFYLKECLLMGMMLGCLNIQAQKQIVTEDIQPVWSSVNKHANLQDLSKGAEIKSPVALNATPAVFTVITVGFGGSQVQACNQIEAKFSSASAFAVGITLYWDPGLNYPLTGSLVLNPATGKIYNLSSGVVGSFTGNYCQ